MWIPILTAKAVRQSAGSGVLDPEDDFVSVDWAGEYLYLWSYWGVVPGRNRDFLKQDICRWDAFGVDTGSTAQRECEPSCTICLDVNHSFPDLFGLSRGAENKKQWSFLVSWTADANGAGGLVRETGRKRLSYRPTIFAKKLQKSREIINFTAFCGGPNRDRTDDLTDANRTLSQLSYRPIFSYLI